jgi:hypothetical protein
LSGTPGSPPSHRRPRSGELAAFEGVSNGGEGLYAAIRRGKHVTGRAEEFVKRVEAGLAPVMSQMARFKAYYLVFGEDDSVTSLTLFDTKEAAEEVNRTLLPWARDNLGPLFAAIPDTMEGIVCVSKIA